jgi:hypothetical protein
MSAAGNQWRRVPEGPALRQLLRALPARDRDHWLNEELGLEAPADDGPALPRGCVPYLPCPVDALVRLADLARIDRSDLFVDIGAGVGRAAVLTHLLTGASALGVEVQSALVHQARELVERLRLERVSFAQADAAELPAAAGEGTVFFLYCPFSGQRLDRLLSQLQAIAQRQPIRVGCLDLPLPPCSWLEPMGTTEADLTVHRSKP